MELAGERKGEGWDVQIDKTEWILKSANWLSHFPHWNARENGDTTDVTNAYQNKWPHSWQPQAAYNTIWFHLHIAIIRFFLYNWNF